MITQTLHKKNIPQFLTAKIKLFLPLFLLLCIILNIKAQKNNTEFQENFFKALTEKAIFNPKNALGYLENCLQIQPNNTAVLFEISKNYTELKQHTLALQYINLAIDTQEKKQGKKQKEAQHKWLLHHKVSILKKLQDFTQAIKVQEKIAQKDPKEQQNLVFLYLQNDDIVGAKKVLSDLKKAKLLNPRLRKIQEKLNQNNNTKNQKKDIVSNSTIKTVKKIATKKENEKLKSTFEKEKSYHNLKLLLENLSLNFQTNNNVNNQKYTKDLIKYSQQGIMLFPMQPFVYLINGKANNHKNQYKKALQNLLNGIDFVIDSTENQAQFYVEIAKAYKGLKKIDKAKIYQQKANEITP